MGARTSRGGKGGGAGGGGGAGMGGAAVADAKAGASAYEKQIDSFVAKATSAGLPPMSNKDALETSRRAADAVNEMMSRRGSRLGTVYASTVDVSSVVDGKSVFKSFPGIAGGEDAIKYASRVLPQIDGNWKVMKGHPDVGTGTLVFGVRSMR